MRGRWAIWWDWEKRSLLGERCNGCYEGIVGGYKLLPLTQNHAPWPEARKHFIRVKEWLLLNKNNWFWCFQIISKWRFGSQGICRDGYLCCARSYYESPQLPMRHVVLRCHYIYPTFRSNAILAQWWRKIIQVDSGRLVWFQRQMLEKGFKSCVRLNEIIDCCRC